MCRYGVPVHWNVSRIHHYNHRIQLFQSSHDKQNKVKTFFAPKVLPGHPDWAWTLILAEFAELFANTGHQLLITIARYY